MPRRSGKTSTNQGHSHSYRLDKNGNGDTSRDQQHVHQVTNFRVMKNKNHTHRLAI